MNENQVLRFTFVSCKNCRFTELYKVSKEKIAGVINFKAR